MSVKQNSDLFNKIVDFKSKQKTDGMLVDKLIADVNQLRIDVDKLMNKTFVPIEELHPVQRNVYKSEIPRPITAPPVQIPITDQKQTKADPVVSTPLQPVPVLNIPRKYIGKK